jgi:hypothetical protein
VKTKPGFKSCNLTVRLQFLAEPGPIAMIDVTLDFDGTAQKICAEIIAGRVVGHKKLGAILGNDDQGRRNSLQYLLQNGAMF